jgi:predicted ArsR family transcriptional regulator
MRAMAHPMRMRILGSLRLDGPATSAILARRLGTDSGQTSHHLRQLAKYGFVEDAPELGKGPRGRERWWRAAHDTTSWDDLSALGPDGEEAVRAFEAAAYRVWAQMLAQYRVEAGRDEWRPEWVAAAGSGDYPVRTTAQGLRALLDELAEVITRHDAAAADDPAAETAVILLHGFPRKPPPP